MLKKLAIAASLTVVASMSYAQEATPPTTAPVSKVRLDVSPMAKEATPARIVNVVRDRSGKRHANKWDIVCDEAGQVFSTGILNKKTRKMFVAAGPTPLRIGLAAMPGTVGDALHGSQIAGWTTLAAKQQVDYGKPQALVAVCTGPGQYYVHAEWTVRSGAGTVIDAIGTALAGGSN